MGGPAARVRSPRRQRLLAIAVQSDPRWAADDPMSTITTLEADLAALDAFLSDEDAHGPHELADFVEQRLRLDNALALAARLPRPLAEMFPNATPLGEWARPAGSSYDVRPTPPEEERAFQWSFRYPAAVVATLERGRRPPVGWVPGN
jgi:hypothetical protein